MQRCIESRSCIVAWRMQTILNDLRWREGERARAREEGISDDG